MKRKEKRVTMMIRNVASMKGINRVDNRIRVREGARRAVVVVNRIRTEVEMIRRQATAVTMMVVVIQIHDGYHTNPHGVDPIDPIVDHLDMMAVRVQVLVETMEVTRESVANGRMNRNDG